MSDIDIIIPSDENPINININNTPQEAEIETQDYNNNTEFNTGGDKAYSDLARDWAIKLGSKVLGQDYSSKYYADLAKQYAEQAIVDVNTAIDEIMENITGTGSIKPEYNNRVLVIKDTTYTHNQVLASNKWIIEHNMNKHPSVTAVDSSGRTWYPPVDYVDENTCIANFLGATTGKAYCN